MSWYCEDAAVNFSAVPAVSRAWHEILTEIDVGIWEQRLDDASWAAWMQAKQEIAAVAIAHGGSMSACHGSCREGEVDLLPLELGKGFDVMLEVKRALDSNNIMNPGKYLLDPAYGRDTTDENR